MKEILSKKIKRCQDFLRERTEPEKCFFPSVSVKDGLFAVIDYMLDIEERLNEHLQIDKEISENPELRDVECLNNLLTVACDEIRKLDSENLELKRALKDLDKRIDDILAEKEALKMALEAFGYKYTQGDGYILVRKVNDVDYKEAYIAIKENK